MDELSDTRIRGTFQFSLRDEGGQGPNTILTEDGSFDVPISEQAGIFYCDLPDADC